MHKDISCLSILGLPTAEIENKRPQFSSRKKKQDPTMSDYLIGCSSTPGRVSFLNPKTGSRYISAIVEVFLKMLTERIYCP